MRQEGIMSVPDHFLRKDWDLDLRAELYKQEFYATRAWADQCTRLVAPWEGSIRAELAELQRLHLERADHVGEIIREQDGSAIIDYWYKLLDIGPITHPLTSELLHATIYLAGSVATYFKARFNRVRPSSLAPDLAPPIPVPQLPAYPGGHATQIHLMARTLVYLMPDREREIRELAWRVARNRERAGVNYPSDTEAGRQLAGDLFEIMRSECPRFRSTLEQAKTNDVPWEPFMDPNAFRASGLPA
jgi:hypothetical protein